MRNTVSYALCLLTAWALFFSACKKPDQPTKMALVQPPPDCEPVRVFSTPVDETYIVMLRETGNQSGNMQTLAESTTAVSAIFSRHAIPVTQRIAMLNAVHSGFVARLNRNQAEALKQDQEGELVEQDRVITLGNGCYEIVSPSTVQRGVKRTGSADGRGKRVWIIDTGVDIDHPDLDVDTVLSKS